MRTAKTLIRLGGCPGWSESSLGAQVILLVLSWGGSNRSTVKQVSSGSALSTLENKFYAMTGVSVCAGWAFPCQWNYVHHKLLILSASWQNQQNDCAPSEDSDQPWHPPSLIRVFAVRMKKAWVLSYQLSAQPRFWWMPRLIWVFAGRTDIVLALSRGGSFCVSQNMQEFESYLKKTCLYSIWQICVPNYRSHRIADLALIRV